MQLIVFIASGLLLAGLGQSKPAPHPSPVILKGVEAKYGNLDEAQILLVNESQQSIYLLPQDCGEAQLWLNYMNKGWRKGVSKNCESRAPIEIKPREHYKIPDLIWRPLQTWDGKLIERKDFPGKYRVVVRYSLKPVSATLVKPQPKLLLVSESSLLKGDPCAMPNKALQLTAR